MAAAARTATASHVGVAREAFVLPCLLVTPHDHIE